MPRVEGTLEDRFWQNVVKTETCWIWVKRGTNNGYGVLVHEGVRLMAHRLSHELFVGQIPDGYEVDHLCRVKRCVHPAHLEAVTKSENGSRSRGRWRCYVGHGCETPAGGYTCPQCDEVVTVTLAPYLGRPSERRLTA